MRAWSSLLVVLLLLALPASAWGGGTLLTQDTRGAEAGPELVGDRIAWATKAEGPEGIDLSVAAPDGYGLTTTTVQAPVDREGTHVLLDLDASASRLAAGMRVVHCTPPCKYQNYSTPFSRLFTAAPGQPLDTVASCPEDYGGPPPRWGHDVSVDGEVVAHRRPCEPDRVVVRDFGAPPGEPATFEHPGTGKFKLAGRFLAVIGQDGGLTVRDWRTGEVVLDLGAAPPNWDMQADGKVAYTAAGDEPPVMWISPESRTPQVVAPASTPGELRIARDRVAFPAASGGVAVRRVDGGHVGESMGVPSVGDFDGERMTFASRPCAVLGLLTWDLQGDPPAMPGGPCPVPRLRSATLRARVGATRAWVPAKITCPAKPALGCEGRVTLSARDGRPRPRFAKSLPIAEGTFSLMPGIRTTVYVEYLERRICIARRHGLRPVLKISVASGAPSDPPKEWSERHRVKVVGLEKAIRACST